jgi:chromosomal replication initiator protein
LNNNERPIKIHWEKKPISKKSSLESTFHIAPDPLEKEFRLELFITGPTTSMAYEMAKEAATGKCPFNPLFFFGPSSSGKTHLLMGLAHALQEMGQKVFYVQAKSFTEHVVQAIRLGQMQEFRKAYREIDVLIIDDIHQLARKNATQEEFFHTFNNLHTLSRLIILSSDAPAKELSDIEPRLISRFEWGIALGLDSPSSAKAIEILKYKAKHLQLDLSPNVIDFLAKRFASLKAAVEALHAIALRCPHQLDLSHIEMTLSDLLQKESVSQLTSDKVIKETAVYFGITPQDLTGESQIREFAKPRQIAMFLCRKLLNIPYQGIGRLFQRDHSTVMSSVKQIETAIEKNPSPLSDHLAGILKKLGRRQDLLMQKRIGAARKLPL